MPYGVNAVANGKVTTHTPFQEGSVQAPAGAADLPDEAALLDQVSAAMKAILRPSSSTAQTNPSSAPRQAKPTPGVHQARRPIGSKRGRSVIPRMP